MQLKRVHLVVFTTLVLCGAFFNACHKENGDYNVVASKRSEKNKNPETPNDSLKEINTDSTKYVIVVVVDGARYADTWEALGNPLIPYRKEMAKSGFLCSSFYNNGTTLTISGHTAICTGVYETMTNSGAQIPAYPSIMQVWRKTFNQPASKAWIVASKDKVEVIKNCTDTKWNNSYNPMTDCGISGLGSGYRDDITTLNKAMEILANDQPTLMLVNFKQPDSGAHSTDSLTYIQGIFDTDNYVNLLWNFIQNNAHYKNKTALMITNDHGRHSPGHLDGFISHGDGCAGCRHIEFLALGPNIKKNYIATTAYQQIDIAPTIAYLLGFKMPVGTGKVMKEMLQ